MHFRFLLFVRAAFARGAPYQLLHVLADRFAAATQGGENCGARYSAKHMRERVAPSFRKNCTEYKFEKIRRGRSWVWKMTRSGEVVGGLKAGEVRARLIGAVRRVVELGGSAHVDAEFLRKFVLLSKLPAEAVAAAWRGLANLPGLRTEWRGVGGGVKFVAWRAAPQNSESSHPQTSPVISSPTGRRFQKNTACGRMDKPDTPAALPPSPRPGWRTGEGTPPQESTAHAPPGPIRQKPKTFRAMPGRFAALPPVQVGEYKIFPSAVYAKALSLGNRELKNLHSEFPRVAHGPHAVNFAFECLWFGYAVPQICAAWREGLRRSHADAVDAGDRVRVPSAAKCYAFAAIQAADARPAAERWAELAAKWTPGGVAGGGSGGGERPARVPAADRLRIVANLRAKVATMERPATPTAAALFAEIERRGLSRAEFAALPYAMKAAIARSAAERSGVD